MERGWPIRHPVVSYSTPTTQCDLSGGGDLTDLFVCVLYQVQTQLVQVVNKLQTEEEMRQQLAVDFDQVSHNKDILLKFES